MFQYVETIQPRNTQKDLMKLLEHGASGPVYIGEAIVGSSQSNSVWKIKKLTYDGSGNLAATLFADGNDNFDNIWDDRASLSYS